MTGKCHAITGKGAPCKGLVRPGSDYCPAHDPDRAEARKRSASKAARSKTGSEFYAIKQRVIEIAEDVLSGTMNRGNAAVAATLYATAIKALEAAIKERELVEARLVETELKVREQEELLQRLDELEARIEASSKHNATRRPSKPRLA